MIFTRRTRDFYRNLKQVSTTEAGKKVLAYLKEDFVANELEYGDSVFMAKQIAEHNFVLRLIEAVDSSELENITIHDDPTETIND